MGRLGPLRHLPHLLLGLLCHLQAGKNINIAWGADRRLADAAVALGGRIPTPFLSERVVRLFLVRDAHLLLALGVVGAHPRPHHRMQSEGRLMDAFDEIVHTPEAAVRAAAKRRRRQQFIRIPRSWFERLRTGRGCTYGFRTQA